MIDRYTMYAIKVALQAEAERVAKPIIIAVAEPQPEPMPLPPELCGPPPTLH